MAITIVQTAQSSSFASPGTATFANPITPHNTVICATYGELSAGASWNVPTASGEVFHTVPWSPLSANGEPPSVALYYAYNCTGGERTVSQVTNQGCCCGVTVPATVELVCLEVSGLTTTDPLDRTSALPGGGTAPSSGAPVISQPSELLIGVCAFYLPRLLTAGSGFGNLITWTSINGGGGVETRIVSAPGSYAATFALNSSTLWGAGIATFKAVSPPAVTGVAPSTGTTAGGTSVVITGTGLTGATSVKFGTNAATAVVVNSDTQITCHSPAGAAGTVDVTVTTPNGTSATGAPDQFTYTAAVVDARCGVGDHPLVPVRLSDAARTSTTLTATIRSPVTLSDAPLN